MTLNSNTDQQDKARAKENAGPMSEFLYTMFDKNRLGENVESGRDQLLDLQDLRALSQTGRYAYRMAGLADADRAVAAKLLPLVQPLVRNESWKAIDKALTDQGMYVSRLAVSTLIELGLIDDLDETAIHLILHSLLKHMQETIARTGKCHVFYTEIARRLLSSNRVNLESKDDDGVSLLQRILGQNKFQLPGRRQADIDIYLPPIVALHDHSMVKVKASDLDLAVSVSTLSRYCNSSFVAVGVAVGVGAGVGVGVGVVAVAVGVGVVAVAVEAGVGVVVGVGVVAGGVAGAAAAAIERGYKHLSSYHNPFIFTRKNLVRLKLAGKALWSGVKAMGRGIAYPFQCLGRGLKSLLACKRASTDVEPSEISPLLGSTVGRLNSSLNKGAAQSAESKKEESESKKEESEREKTCKARLRYFDNQPQDTSQNDSTDSAIPCASGSRKAQR